MVTFPRFMICHLDRFWTVPTNPNKVEVFLKSGILQGHPRSPEITSSWNWAITWYKISIFLEIWNIVRMSTITGDFTFCGCTFLRSHDCGSVPKITNPEVIFLLYTQNSGKNHILSNFKLGTYILGLNAFQT